MSDELIERRKQVLSPAYYHFYDKPLYLVRGEGVWLFDDEGNRYLDCYNNVASVGHCHPYVVEQVTKQIGTLKEERKLCRSGVGSERISPARGTGATQSAAGTRTGNAKRKHEAYEFNNIKKDMESMGRINNENSRQAGRPKRTRLSLSPKRKRRCSRRRSTCSRRAAERAREKVACSSAQLRATHFARPRVKTPTRRASRVAERVRRRSSASSPRKEGRTRCKYSPRRIEAAADATRGTHAAQLRRRTAAKQLRRRRRVQSALS